ncbi:LD-carboxypeptidase [Planktothrix sp. FACHB-1355]|uniref:LD-carboxypeptidase n=1 Tax=Aerosakkonema funiforme FACHB-1375 TaxID=2949571 RepID=A0A926VI33_9CYAN|nr:MULTISPECIES: LD-carboxypeptidase [Oscillatoriales]MBD2184270.1 LD-carboxypeptidase [Aerosakkonema funiforme FACHB-1375]MBD3560339.1 LD-carboxypeptidase [Planktothrix sp. FACHB-1355]
MNICQLPPSLQPGDLLKVVAPSGALREYQALEKGVQIWCDRGYRVEVTNVQEKWGYLAGKDEHRRRQLQEAWHNPEVKGILCVRGGYGSTRLLEDWIWTVGERASKAQFPITNPKWLIGFSDVTALLWSLSKIGISGVHGPLLTTIASEPDWSIQRLFDWVEGKQLQPLQGVGWGGGKVSGILLPANLTVATHLLGTPLQPELDEVILALEDVTEFPYRIDRQLTQWRMMGIFQKVKGIALGRFSRCEAPEGIPSFSIEEVLRDRLCDLGIPIGSDLPFGHDGPNACLPMGVPVELDGDRGMLSFR